MGCGSSVSQVAEMSRESGFRPVRLLEMSQYESSVSQGRIFLFGQTRTQRKILECGIKSNSINNISTRTRIPFPKIHLDPIESLYEQSQQIFHLGIYGFSMQPPFNNMLALFLQSNLIFMCGGRDYDCFNIKNEAYFYNVFEEPYKISSEMIHSNELNQRTLYRPKYSSNKFEKMASMNKRRYSHTGIYCSNLKSILVFGGINEREEVLNCCQMYNLFDNSWKELPPMKKPRANAHCFQYCDRIYVFGGRSNQKKLTKKIQVFKFDTHEWQYLNVKLHKGIQKALIFSLHPNEILIVGGKTYSGCTKTVVKVNLKEQTYVWDSQLAYEYQSPVGDTVDNQIFLLGGQKDEFEAYIQNKWRNGSFSYKKWLQIEDFQRFCFAKDNLVVKLDDKNSQQLIYNESEQLFFGNDLYPCLIFYNKNTGKLRKVATPLAIRLKSNMGIVEYEQGMFMLIGGSDYTERRVSRSCFIYNRYKNKGQFTLKMSQKRYNFALANSKGFIFVFGGYNSLEKRDLTSCQRYNISEDKWEDIKSLRVPLSNIFAEPIKNDKIALIDSRKCPFILDIDIYDVKKDQYYYFHPKIEIPGVILMTYSYNDENCIYLLRYDEQSQYRQCKLQFNFEDNQLQQPIQVTKETNLEMLPSIKNIEQEIKKSLHYQLRKQSENSHEEPKMQEEQKSEEISNKIDNYKQPDIEKQQAFNNINAMTVFLKPKMIEVKQKKITEESISEEHVESEFSEENVEVHNVKLEESIVEIRLKGNFAANQETQMNQEAHQRAHLKKDVNDPCPTVKGGMSKYNNSVDNQSKGAISGISKQVLEVVEKLQDKGSEMAWLKGQKYRFIKRKQGIYCLTDKSILSWNTESDKPLQFTIQNFEQAKLEWLS